MFNALLSRIRMWKNILFGLKYLLRRFGLGFWTLQKDIATVSKELKTVAVSQLSLADEFKAVHESLSDVHEEFFKTARALRESSEFEARITNEVAGVRGDTLVIRQEIKEIWDYLKNLPEECLTGDCPYKRRDESK